jgi:hypothetical protein
MLPASTRIGPSAVDAAQLGIVPGEGWLTFVQTDDLDRYELEHDVTLDADGNLGVVERPCIDDRPARILLDTYLLGDARQSTAAASELEGAVHDRGPEFALLDEVAPSNAVAASDRSASHGHQRFGPRSLCVTPTHEVRHTCCIRGAVSLVRNHEVRPQGDAQGETPGQVQDLKLDPPRGGGAV